jgi:hypothetical protein
MQQPPILLQHQIHRFSIHSDPFLLPEQRPEVSIPEVSSREGPGPIHLLLTDTIMPVMNGPELTKPFLSFTIILDRFHCVSCIPDGVFSLPTF